MIVKRNHSIAWLALGLLDHESTKLLVVFIRLDCARNALMWVWIVLLIVWAQSDLICLSIWQPKERTWFEGHGRNLTLIQTCYRICSWKLKPRGKVKNEIDVNIIICCCLIFSVRDCNNRLTMFPLLIIKSNP